MSALAIASAGCTVIDALPVPSSPLVTVTTRGGECFDGPCGDTFVIERAGSVHRTTHGEAEIGQVPADIIGRLDAAIKTTDFDAVRAVPFDGECPTAFDGQEILYAFGAPGGVETIASCESRIDPAHPAFAAVDAALVSVGILAAP
jgi:hypothetical protein